MFQSTVISKTGELEMHNIQNLKDYFCLYPLAETAAYSMSAQHFEHVL